MRPCREGLADDLGGGLGLGLRRIERPEGRPGAGQPDRPRQEPAERPPERHEGRERRAPSPGAGRWPTRARRHGRRGRRRTAPIASSSARCVDVSRTDAVAVRRGSRRTRRRRRPSGRATAGVTSRTPGRAVEPVERRDPLAAALDERRAAGAGRTARPSRGRAATAGARRGIELGAPCLERAVDGGRGIRRAAAEPGGDRDPLLEPGRERRRGSGAAGQPPPTACRASPRSRGGRGCRPAARGRSP